MARIGGDFDPVTDPTVTYNSYSGGTAETINIPAIPGSIAITTINSVSGPTITFSGGTTGLAFTPGGTTITLTGTLAIASGGTGATTVAGILTNIGIAKQTATNVAPTVDDDDANGYSINSLWTDTTGPITYVCQDATTGAAVWSQIFP